MGLIILVAIAYVVWRFRRNVAAAWLNFGSPFMKKVDKTLDEVAAKTASEPVRKSCCPEEEIIDVQVKEHEEPLKDLSKKNAEDLRQ